MNKLQTTRVVIIGAGFGGLWAAKALAKHKNISVILIDRNNYHTFLPLLYQVAAAELEPAQIASPIRGIFQKHLNVRTVLDEATSINTEEHIVSTSSGLSFTYDHLIVATGSTTAFYGVPGAEEHTFTMKSLEGSIKLRNRLLSCFEAASQMLPEKRSEGMLRVAVVGAGPTGVEYAGALMELIKAPLAKDFPELAECKPEVMIIDGSDYPLHGFPDKLRHYTAKHLKKMGVHLYMGTPVAKVSPTGLTLKDGTFIRVSTIVWAAGVQGEASTNSMGLAVGNGGKVAVLPTLQVEDHPEIHVIGDVALVKDQSLPMVAPNATQQGSHAAKNILRVIDNKESLPFKYLDKGSMVTIGRSSAVARVGKSCNFTGFPAWILWIVVHLAYLIGFQNRLLVLINWAWDYLFFERAVRLILPKDESVTCGCTLDEEEPQAPPQAAP